MKKLTNASDSISSKSSIALTSEGARRIQANCIIVTVISSIVSIALIEIYCFDQKDSVRGRKGRTMFK